MYVGKEEIIVLCDLSSLQADLYQYVLTLPDFENAKYGAHVCDCEDARKITRTSNSGDVNNDALKKGRNKKDPPQLRKNCCKKYRIPITRTGGQESDGFISPYYSI